MMQSTEKQTQRGSVNEKSEAKKAHDDQAMGKYLYSVAACIFVHKQKHIPVNFFHYFTFLLPFYFYSSFGLSISPSPSVCPILLFHFNVYINISFWSFCACSCSCLVATNFRRGPFLWRIAFCHYTFHRLCFGTMCAHTIPVLSQVLYCQHTTPALMHAFFCPLFSLTFPIFSSKR